jgi:alkanesulfonate monooxygenase SsuD/methylene tetrahydromethanopterin reductase-like flavin-dependent oxidoreductase (luciferase family)
MKLGTSLRFLFPTGEHTYPQFRRMLDAMPPGGFAERPMGAFDTAEQANNVLELAETAATAGFDGLLFGDSHGVTARYANAFSPIPTVARLMAVTGDMPVGMVILAPFYQPIILAEQLGTLAAFARAPLTIVLANGGGPNAFKAFGYEMGTRARRLEELAHVLRSLLAGESVTFEGRHLNLQNVSISPLPRVPVEIWIAGTVAAAAKRAGTIGDGWLSGQNASDDESVRQLEIYRDAAAQSGRPARAVLRRDIFVAETDAAAHAEVDRVLAEGYRGTGKDELLVGSPESVVKRLAYYRGLGFEEVMVRHVSGNHGLIKRSIELIGQSVLPVVHSF